MLTKLSVRLGAAARKLAAYVWHLPSMKDKWWNYSRKLGLISSTHQDGYLLMVARHDSERTRFLAVVCARNKFHSTRKEEATSASFNISSAEMSKNIPLAFKKPSVS